MRLLVRVQSPRPFFFRKSKRYGNTKLTLVAIVVAKVAGSMFSTREHKMAYWQRKQSGSRKIVAVYVKKAGRARALPRHQVKHLDDASDDEIQRWVDEFGNARGVNYGHHSVGADNSILVHHLDQFCSFLKLEGRMKSTIRQHRSLLLRFVFPYFCQQTPPLTNPEDWHQTSIKFQPWLETNNVTIPVRKRTNISLRTFYRYLYEEGVVKYHPQLRLRNPRSPENKTPLRSTLNPDEIVSYVESCEVRDLRLIALIGFGFSLRPQEIVALRPIDFRAGSPASALECCKSLGRAGLFDRLAVVVHRQRVGNEFNKPKSSSNGAVGCIDERIARLLVREIVGLKSDDLLFKYKLDWYYELWRRQGIHGFTIKDLRRASILWLGHHTRLEFVCLKSHARHKDPATTALYVRRPEDKLAEWRGLDLEI
jgi:hypothetical protein